MKSSGLWLRSLAAILDISIVFTLWFLIIETWGTSASDTLKTLSGLPALLLFVATAAFWILPEWLAGATFGKWSCDLRVASMNGNKITFSQSVKRNLLRLVDFVGGYLVGFITAKLTPNHQRLGDLWAKTLVVRYSEIKQHSNSVVPENGSSSEI